jgi:hypothetical protein
MDRELCVGGLLGLYDIMSCGFVLCYFLQREFWCGLVFFFWDNDFLGWGFTGSADIGDVCIITFTDLCLACFLTTGACGISIHSISHFRFMIGY